MAFHIVNVAIDMRVGRRGCNPAVGYIPSAKSLREEMRENACVTFWFADGTCERCNAVYLGRGVNRDVYDVSGVVRGLGECVVVKLAPVCTGGAQKAERDVLLRNVNKWLPRLFYFGCVQLQNTIFEVLVMTRCATSVDKLLDRLKNQQCTYAAAWYIEQLLKEVLYMLLFGFEEQGVSFGDLHLANVGVKVSPEDFMPVPVELPGWDESGFGRCVIGVVCVDAEGVLNTELRGRLLNKLLKTFLTSFHQGVSALQHPSWQLVVRAVSDPLMNYIENEASYSLSGMQELRRQAAIMGMNVRGRINKAMWSHGHGRSLDVALPGVTPPLLHFAAPPPRLEEARLPAGPRVYGLLSCWVMRLKRFGLLSRAVGANFEVDDAFESVFHPTRFCGSVACWTW